MIAFTPHHYQIEAREFIRKHRRVALFLDCGLGKTVICLDCLNRYRDMLPALIVAPLRCVTNVWPEEVGKWGFDLSCSVVHGAKKVDRLIERTDLKVTNYESLGWLLDEIKTRGRCPFKTIIFDEASKLKSPTSKRTRFATAISEVIPNRVLLTGTPIPQGYADLWSQFFILDRGERFGTYHNFISKAFDLDHFNRPTLKFGWDERIEKTIAPITYRGDAGELLELPPLMESTVRVTLPDRIMDRYEEVEYGYLNGVDDLESHTEANYAPMRCFCSGFLYQQTDGFEGREVERIHKLKLDAIDEIWNENQRKPLLVVFNFRGEREMLVERFGCQFIDGTTDNESADLTIAAWNAGDLSVLAVQPQSVGFGLNLQHGGRHMVWMSLPDSGEIYTQTVARLHRQGQSGPVMVYRIVCKKTIEEAIDGLLRKKILTQANLLDALNSKLEVI